jgi:hypothetical protein
MFGHLRASEAVIVPLVVLLILTWRKLFDLVRAR